MKVDLIGVFDRERCDFVHISQTGHLCFIDTIEKATANELNTGFSRTPIRMEHWWRRFTKGHQHFPVKVITTERTNIDGMNDISCILAYAPFTINDRVEDDSIICISDFIPEGQTHSELGFKEVIHSILFIGENPSLYVQVIWFQ